MTSRSAAAGLTFYATVALVPLLLVALWLASLVLGGPDVRSLGHDLGDIVGTRHGLDDAVRRLTVAGSQAQIPALITAVLISTLYGEGLTRALARLGKSGEGKPVGAPARRAGCAASCAGGCAAPLLVAASGVLVGGGWCSRRGCRPRSGASDKATVLGVYLAFLVVLGRGDRERPALLPRVRSAPTTVRRRCSGVLPARGRGSPAPCSASCSCSACRSTSASPSPAATRSGTAALLIFWLYFSHIAVLLGYAVALRLSAGPRGQRGDAGDGGAERTAIGRARRRRPDGGRRRHPCRRPPGRRRAARAGPPRRRRLTEVSVPPPRSLHRHAVRVQEALVAAGSLAEVRQLTDSARTAAEAAEALGVEIGAIVNSLVFRAEATDGVGEPAPLLVLTSGAHRVDVEHLGGALDVRLRRADADFVRAATGQPIGGVAPVGHPRRVRTVVDRALAAHPVVWAAAGIPTPSSRRRSMSWCDSPAAIPLMWSRWRRV